MITDIFSSKKPVISFEVFPPKKDEDFPAVYETLDALGALSPDFISITYGAGGSRTGKTIEISSYIKEKLGIPPLAHITCVGFSKSSLDDVCLSLANAGISDILALRGDRPQWMDDAQYDSREFMYASDMAAYLKSNTTLNIAGACYPEKHFEALSAESDLEHLRIKVESGVSFLITQLFFDNDAFYRFIERVRAKGINVPICAGIMPITTAKQLGTTVSLSGSSVPVALSEIIARFGDDKAEMKKAGIDYAIRQIQDLRANGVDGIHIYTMNKADIARRILDALKKP